MPLVAMASWWNPLSWFKKKAVQVPLVQTQNNSNNDKEIQNLKKQVEELKKKSDSQNKSTVQAVTSIIKKQDSQATLISNSSMDLISKQKEVENQRLDNQATADATYVIRKGDSLKRIAEMLGVSIDDIKKLNNFTEEPKFTVGQNIIIPDIKFSQSVLSAPSVPTETIYSDYNLNYKVPVVNDESQWQLRLTLPQTNRDIRIVKAVFKISDEDATKLDKISNFPLQLWFSTHHGIYPYTLERTDKNTFTYLSTRFSGMPITQGNYLQLSLLVNDWEANKALLANVKIPISEWEIWDNTTSKPVKTY